MKPLFLILLVSCSISAMAQKDTILITPRDTMNMSLTFLDMATGRGHIVDIAKDSSSVLYTNIMHSRRVALDIQSRRGRFIVQLPRLRGDGQTYVLQIAWNVTKQAYDIYINSVNP